MGVFGGESIEELWESELEIWESELEIDRKLPQADVSEVQEAVSRLCTSLNNVKQGVSDIIEPSEDGCSYVPMINSEGGEYSDLFAEYGFVKSDWDTLKESIAGNTRNAVIKKEDLPAWLRRHYNNVCFQFETQISNARGNLYDGGSVFGDYTMAQLYTNARVSVKGTEKTEVMLDFVEKWFDNELPNGMPGETRVIKKEKSSAKEKYGRVLVLHGQPGDGKTTFCKKAVYAHCKEGWLPEASQVLWLSLNPYDSNNEIVSGDLKELALEKAFCLKRNPASKGENYFCRPAEFNHALIIFDGYDELKGELLTDPEAGTFRQFCEKVIALASASPEYKLNAIITSRSMCIEEELRELEKSNIQGVTVAAFAELSEVQQDAMVDRMMQLDQERERDESEAIYEDDYYDEDDNDEDEERYREQSLKDYKEKILPELRKNDKLNDLLKNPSLFRMIVTRRFDDYEGIRNVAELYHNLVRGLLGYKQRGKDKKQKEKDRIDVLIEKYEGISARIFVDDTETCVYDGKDDADEQELVYAFLTKNDETEKGRLGFLHGSFRQYFFACHIISLIGRCEAEGSEAVIADLLKLLGSRRIAESFVWQLISQVAELKQEQKGFSQAYIKNVLDGVEKIDDLARVMSEREWTPELQKHSTAEKNDMSAAENALFNLFGCVAAAEKGCLGLTGETDGRRIAAKKEKRLPFGGNNGYANICAWLRKGDYSEIYLEGLNLSNCNLGSACLENAVLKGAWLAGEEMVLDGARLAGANMEHADLQKASLRGVRFSNITHAGATSSNDATVKHANLRGAHLEDTHLERSVLSGVNLEKACLDRAHLESASFVGANLDEAIIRNAYLIETDLKYASLKKVDFEKSHLECAGLEGANLQGGILNRTHMEEAVLRGAVLEEAELKGTHLEATKLGAAFLDGSNLEAAYLTEADLKGAFLTENMYNQLKDPRYHLLELKPELPNKRIEVAGICREDGSLISGNRRAIDLSKDRDIEFGQYPHDDKDDIQPIRWRVLRREYDKVLLITEELIDCHRYHDTDEPVTWEECSLRKWLNEEFLFKAFPDAADRDRIALVCNQNPDNPRYGTKGGNPTWDRVFALSIEEAERYFPKGDDDRMATVTPYAGSPHDGLRGSDKDNRHQTSHGKGTGWWWLRSPGSRSLGAVGVFPDGGVDVIGYHVDGDDVSVRPALWLNL